MTVIQSAARSQLLVCLIIISLMFVSYEVWDDWSASAERRLVKENMPGVSGNRNIHAIAEIKETLHNRSDFRFIFLNNVERRVNSDLVSLPEDDYRHVFNYDTVSCSQDPQKLCRCTRLTIQA